MNYPFWDIPYLGSGWVIGIIAIFHVMISQFAVGGGLYLPLAERKALREGRGDWLKELVGYSKFFLILTGVFGTISGVGIWFAIGLTNPEATSTLIHNFVFGWAIEWVFFMVELITAAVYYYTWNKIDAKLHLVVGWVYAGASVCTLIIINGILTFMLTPGDTWLAVAGTGNEASKFWNAFFNPTYWPSLLLRTCVCASLAGIWALISASRIDGSKQPSLKSSLVKWSVKWLVPSFVAMPLLFAWYLFMVPASQRALLTLGIDTIGSGYLLDDHAHCAADRDYLGHDYRRCVLPCLSQSGRFQCIACSGDSTAGADRDGSRRVLARDAPQTICDRPLDVLKRGARALCAEDRPAGLSGSLELGVERSRHELLARRGDLPRRVWRLPHA